VLSYDQFWDPDTNITKIEREEKKNLYKKQFSHLQVGLVENVEV